MRSKTKTLAPDAIGSRALLAGGVVLAGLAALMMFASGAAAQDTAAPEAAASEMVKPVSASPGASPKQNGVASRRCANRPSQASSPSVSHRASQAAFAWVSGRLVFDLRSLMFERILDLPTAYFDATSTGTMINKVTHNVTQVTSAATKVLMVLVRDSVVVIGLVAYLLYLNWRFSLLVFVLLPVLVLAVRLIAKRLRVLSRSIQSSMGDITHVLGEAVRGHKVIKVFGGQAAERERFVRSANWIRRYQFKTKIADSASEPLVEFIAAVMIAVLIYVGTGQLGHEPMSVGAFVSFLAALGLLFPPIKRLVGINQPLQAGLAGAESVF